MRGTWTKIYTVKIPVSSEWDGGFDQKGSGTIFVIMRYRNAEINSIKETLRVYFCTYK